MSKIKKIISLLLSVIMIMSVFNIVPLGVSAAEAEAAETGATSGTSGNCTWSLDNGVLTISGNGNMKDYDVDWYDDYVTTAPWGNYSFNTVVIESGVTSIGNYAFYGCTGLTGIDIPDSVTSISSQAFYKCAGLTSVTIPDSVTSIGSAAFYGCTGLTSVHISNIEAWCSIDFSNSNSNPLYYAHNLYLNDSLITDLVIPDSVTSIGYSAFSGCTGLTSVTLGDSVTSIGGDAFYGCTGLTSVTIPDSVTSIGSSAFYNTAWYNNQPDGLVYAGKVAYKMKGTCPSEVVIKDGTLGIANYAFSGCTGLTNVDIPDSVTSIGSAAFYDCTGLTSIDIPDSVTSIGGHAFSGCTGLTSIEIPDSVTSIGSAAFYDCTGLTSIDIPDSVTSIGDFAFYNTAWYNNQPDGLVYAGKVAYDMKGTCPSEVVIKDGTLGIAGSAFSGCTSLTYVSIPDSVTSIGSAAFFDCTGLTSVTIPDSVTSIGKYAFEGCTGLTSIEIPDSVTCIGYEAFSGCTGLTSVTIPDSVTSIGYKALGYYYDNGYKKISGFKIYGYKDTEAEKYAKNNGFSFKSGATVKGTVTSYVDDSDVTVKLTGADNNFTAEVKGKADYSFEAVPAGEYTLTVSKANHVTHEYTVTVADADVTQDVKICPKGDVNGDGETDIMDCSVAQRYIRELTTLDAYQIACGDVSGEGDGELDIQDVSRILRHIRELAMLY